MNASRRGTALLLLAALGLAAGCSRPRRVQAPHDDEQVVADSFTVVAREAADRWDAGIADEAAALTARTVLEAYLARPAAPFAERARTLLDSLGFGAEIAGDDHLVVANFFSRGNPEAGSWPYLFWRQQGEPRMQRLEAPTLKLTDFAARGLDAEHEPTDSAQVAVLFGRRAPGGQQPVVLVWGAAAGGRWDLAQTLPSDSLGGIGTAEFARGDTAIWLDTRTFRATRHFDECPTCPHVNVERRFLWSKRGFVRKRTETIPSPYASFAAFVNALVDENDAESERLVADPALITFARNFEWHLPSGRWRVAPTTNDAATEMVFLRGSKDAFRVVFEPRGGDWVIAGFEAVERSVE